VTVEGTTIIASRGYIAQAGQTDFGFPLKVPTPGDLAVFVDTLRKALGTDYTVAGAGSQTGATVTFLSPMAGGESVLLQLDLPYTQPTDYLTGSVFQADQHEDALDRQVLLTRQLLDRAWRVPTFSPFSPPTHLNVQLPDMVPGAVLRVNGSGDGLAWAPVPVADLPPTLTVNAQDVVYDSGTNVESELDAMRTKNAAQDATLSAHLSAITATTNQSNSNASAIASIQVRLRRRPQVTDSQWGATGNGVTDDAPAFKACRDATNGRFDVPAGTYLLLSNVMFTTGCDVYGAGNNATSLIYRGNYDCFTVQNNHVPWSIRDIGFGHDRSTGTPMAGAALKLTTAAGGIMDNVQIFAPYTGIHMEPPDNRGAPNNHFHNITIGYMEYAGVALLGSLGNAGGYFKDVVIVGAPEPGDSTHGPGTAWLLRDHVEGLQVIGGDLIYCQYGMDARSVNYGFADRVEYNTFDHMQFDSCINNVYLERCAFMRFDNVWCASSANDGYRIVDSGAIAINGGIVYNNGRHGISMNGGAFSEFNRFQGITVLSNSVGAPGICSGIHVDAGATDFMITGNACGSSVNFPSYGVQKYGIEVANGASDRYFIEGNLVKGNTTAGVFDGGGGNNKSVARNY